MPGPPRLYTNNAARQRAYRARKQGEMTEEREFAEATSVHAYALQAAVKAAWQAGAEGDPVARKVYRDDPIELLRALIDHFHDQAGTAPSARPWLPEDPEGGAGSKVRSVMRQRPTDE